ncbi:hypothetical protein UYSO10_5135 [Kosakonia radicincitans]|nr:hypothetical protein UYSO10_5135 [Kosakonia radicincitans]
MDKKILHGKSEKNDKKNFTLLFFRQPASGPYRILFCLIIGLLIVVITTAFIYNK